MNLQFRKKVKSSFVSTFIANVGSALFSAMFTYFKRREITKKAFYFVYIHHRLKPQ